MVEYLSHSSDQTIDLAYKIGMHLKKGDVLCLKGDLAGGKTTFTKGIGKSLNIKDIINSPTFNILKIYEGDLSLFHIDAYRLDNSDYDLGFDEFLDEGISVIEWPEYFKNYLPKEYLEIEFIYQDENDRKLIFRPHGERYTELLKELDLC